MASIPTDPSHVVVVFGASGDLASRKMYPTLWALFRESALPEGCQIIGYDQSQLSVAKWREKYAGTVRAERGEDEMLEQFWSVIHYVAGNYDQKKDFATKCLQVSHFHDEGIDNFDI